MRRTFHDDCLRRYVPHRGGSRGARARDYQELVGKAGTGGVQVFEAGPDGFQSLTRRHDYRKVEFTHVLTRSWMLVTLPTTNDPP
jgi:hypothetical protein